MNVSPLIIWLSPASLERKGIPQSASAIYCQGPKIQIDLDTQTDGEFLLATKIWKLGRQARRHYGNFYFSFITIYYFNHVE